MQYKQATERATMISIEDTYVPTADNSQARRTRSHLISILSVVIVLAAIHLSRTVFRGATPNEEVHHLSGFSIAQPIVEIWFCVFGISVAYRYFARGLRVFAWLNIVSLILYSLGVVILIIFMIMETNSLQQIVNGEKSYADMLTQLSNVVLVTIIVLLVALIVTVIVTVVIILLSLRLARLIDVPQHSAIPQI